ncbi:MAG: hypothetical protein PVH84_17070 [Candidatus Aminicenantes bacterium]
MKDKKYVILIFTFVFILGVTSIIAQENENEYNRGRRAPDDLPDITEGALGKVIHIPVPAFVNDGDEPDGYFFSFADGYMSAKFETGCCMSAPIVFPEGASNLKSVKILVWDSNAISDEWFNLYRMDLLTGGAQYLGTAETSGTGGPTVLTITPSSGAIGVRYAYYLGTCLRIDVRVYGAAALYD